MSRFMIKQTIEMSIVDAHEIYRDNSVKLFLSVLRIVCWRNSAKLVFRTILESKSPSCENRLHLCHGRIV